MDTRDDYESTKPVLRLVKAGDEPRRLLMDLYGPSNSGKTYSALVIASGIVDEIGGNIAMIDTEGRGNLYERKFTFDRWVMDSPFSPEAFMKAYEMLDSRYSVIITDTISDEYEGIGGLQEIAEAQKVQNEVAKWAAPKARHRKLMARVRQLKAQHIFCVRAEDKIEIVEGEDQRGNKKKLVRPLGWTRVAEKKWKYDMTVGLRFEPDARGVCIVDKMIEDLEGTLVTGEVVPREFGRSLARWALGKDQPAKVVSGPSRVVTIVDADGQIVATYTSYGEAVAGLKMLVADFPSLPMVPHNKAILEKVAKSTAASPELRQDAQKLLGWAAEDAGEEAA